MGIFLLCLVGLACIYGTVFYAANARLGDNAIPQAKAKVFNAWWFFLLLGVFFTQFVISTWHVTKMSLALWWKRDFSRSRAYLMQGPGRASVAPAGGADEVERVLRGRFTRVHREGGRFFAHAGLRQRIGPTVIHAGIVVILLAGMARFLLYKSGYIISDGRFIGEEGETTSVIFLPKHDDQAMSSENSQAVRLPAEITVLDFDEIFHANSQSPAYYSSLLRVKDLRTGRVRVVKLDMNHSATIAGLEFHQASYQKLPPMQKYRTDFDVRDARTGERIAVTDASPETRVQVGDEDLYLEVDGELPGAAWRLYTAANPHEPVATGTLLAPEKPRELTVALRNFYPDFAFSQEAGPHTESNKPIDPAVEVELRIDGAAVGSTLLFEDPQKQELVPAVVPEVDVRLADIHVRMEGDDWSFEGFDWTNPDSAFFEFEVLDRATGAVLGNRLAAFNQPSEPVELAAADTGQQPPAEALYAVSPIGRSTRHITILSVVREPVVPYYIFGVALIAVGAVITFSGRYRAFHGLWDDEEQRLHFALIPRFGKAPDAKEFQSLVKELGGAVGPAGANEVGDGANETPEREQLVGVT
ncbi:MAG: cytochrome c biosis protein [Candidatus Sumerlaeota bacterium]|nr:cytochrome c biosis protein [Candidatus Sumerlaeota bacterium]